MQNIAPFDHDNFMEGVGKFFPTPNVSPILVLGLWNFLGP